MMLYSDSDTWLSRRHAYGLKAHMLNMIMYTLGVFPLTYLIVNLRPNVSVEKNVTTVNMVTQPLHRVQHHLLFIPKNNQNHFLVESRTFNTSHACNIFI